LRIEIFDLNYHSPSVNLLGFAMRFASLTSHLADVCLKNGCGICDVCMKKSYEICDLKFPLGQRCRKEMVRVTIEHALGEVSEAT